MIILDSNVISEIWRPKPNASVLVWFDAQIATQLYLCTPVLAELYFGAERLPPSRRRDILKALIKRLETEGYRERILPFDIEAAANFGRIGALREQAGRRMEPVDAMIAAIALTYGMKLATGNLHDFEGIGLDLIDPFAASVSH